MNIFWLLKREVYILIAVLVLLLSGPAGGAEAKAIGGLENQPIKTKIVEIKEALPRDKLQTISGPAKPEMKPANEILPPPPEKEIPSGRRCCIRR